MCNEKSATPQVTHTAPRIDLATAWAEGYRSGVTDERISESNIGIAGFGAKIEPARANPYMIDASPKGVTLHNDGSSEAQFIADTERLNCPACGGSGHVDDTPKGGSDAPASMHATDLASLLWKELSNAGFLIGGPDFEAVAHPIDKARFLAIAETVQDAMQATSAEVGE